MSRSDSHKPHVVALQFDCGYLSPYFVTHPERMEVAFTNVCILVHEEKISCKKDQLPLLEQITKSGKPLLIIAEDFGDEALAMLVVNKLCGPLQVVAVHRASEISARICYRTLPGLPVAKPFSKASISS